MSIDLAQIITWVFEKRFDLVVVLTLVLAGGYFKKWVWGYQLEEMKAERDEWKHMALRGTAFAEEVVSTAEQAVKLARTTEATKSR